MTQARIRQVRRTFWNKTVAGLAGSGKDPLAFAKAAGLKYEANARQVSLDDGATWHEMPSRPTEPEIVDETEAVTGEVWGD